jgi:dynein heavy chain, axonemal
MQADGLINCACAAHASVLFFCVVDMASIDPMYQYSLVYFISLFLRSIEAAPKSKDVPTRLQSLKDHFTYFLYVNVCRSLFERHKLLFAFNLSTKLALAQEELSAVQMNFLLTGGIAMENPHANPLDGTLSEKGWGEVCRLADLGGKFGGLRDAMRNDQAAWHEYVSSETLLHVNPIYEMQCMTSFCNLAACPTRYPALVETPAT